MVFGLVGSVSARLSACRKSVYSEMQELLALRNTQRGIEMGFKISCSGDSRNMQFWGTSNFGTRLGGSLAAKRVSKPMACKMESSGDFQN